MDSLPPISAAVVSGLISGLIILVIERILDWQQGHKHQVPETPPGQTLGNDLSRNPPQQGPKIAKPKGKRIRRRWRIRLVVFIAFSLIFTLVYISLTLPGSAPNIAFTRLLESVENRLNIPFGYDTHVYSGEILRNDDYVFTSGSSASKLVMQTDGNLVLYTNSEVPIWANGQVGTGGAGASYQLHMQTDGNLVEYCYETSQCNYQDGFAIWASHTMTVPGTSFVLSLNTGGFEIQNDQGSVISYSCNGIGMCR